MSNVRHFLGNPISALQTPRIIHVVIDDLGEPCFSASWPNACHEHITDAIEMIPEAKTWRVYAYMLQA